MQKCEVNKKKNCSVGIFFPPIILSKTYDTGVLSRPLHYFFPDTFSCRSETSLLSL